MLISHLEKYGCEVETSTELTRFEQHDDYVTVQLKKTAHDGSVTEETTTASYLVGADGTRGA